MMIAAIVEKKHTPGPWRIDDAQLRKERIEAAMSCHRSPAHRSRFVVFLDHESEPAAWTIWKSPFNGRWYGTNNLDDRVIDAPTLQGAKQDLRLCNFPNRAAGLAAIAKAEGR